MIEINSLTLSFHDKLIFDTISVNIQSGDRIGLVGSNGAGKTTFLKTLIDPSGIDEGSIKKASCVQIGYLPQDGIIVSGKTLYDEVESTFYDIQELQDLRAKAEEELHLTPSSSPNYTEILILLDELDSKLHFLEEHKLKSKIETILMGLGFTLSDLNRDTSEFSGGWQMRIALAKLLLKNPPVLLLDEPTNHLDLPSLRWVEKFLQAYQGAIILVSHDRYFLDKLCNNIFHLSLGKLNVYPGNYSRYEILAAEKKAVLEKAAKNQQKYLDQQSEFIERFRSKATKARQVQSRIKLLDKVERIELEEEEANVHFYFPAAQRSGQIVLELKQATKTFPAKSIFSNLNIKVERNDKIAIVGVNGAGKSTLLKVLAAVESLDSGELIYGYNASISYFAQHQSEELNPELSLFETLQNISPNSADTYIRRILGSFLFSGNDVFKKVKVLSGGEKNRLAMAKMLIKSANCLLLDEPTNHLDMKSKLTLQNALKSYDGTFLVISHDRSFLDGLVNKVWEVSPNSVSVFYGTFSEYLARTELSIKVDTMKEVAEDDSTRIQANLIDQKVTGSTQMGNKQIRKKIKENKNRLTALESLIHSIENKIEGRKNEFQNPEFFKKNQSADMIKELSEWENQLENAYHEWTTVQSELTALEKL